MIVATFMLVAGMVLLFGSIFWVWMLVDCATKESDLGNTKIVWLLIILFTHMIGALLYFFVRRPERIYAGAPFSRP